MINETTVAEWHAAVRAEQKKLGANGGDVGTSSYAAGNATQRGKDLAALKALETILLKHGFEQPHLDGNRWLSKYGPIVIRIYVEHHDKDCMMFTLVADDETNNHEVAEYMIKFLEGAPSPEITENRFDVAGLVLPKHG